MAQAAQQSALDRQNAAFWDELCGTGMAQSLGITEVTPENLRRFDQAYLGYYPYLSPYVTHEPLQGKTVLEIGLGYGTLSQLLAEQGCTYYGLDIARGPVDMVRYRLALLGVADSDARVQQGSALSIPHPSAVFDYVYTIGCLHHTGDLPQSVREVHRVLRPGGKAVVMLYHKHSFRQVVIVPLKRLRAWRRGQRRDDRAAAVRAMYDTNQEGEAAPHTEYVSRREVRVLFGQFAQVKIDSQNMDDPFHLLPLPATLPLGIPLTRFRKRVRNPIPRSIPREKVLNNLGRVAGLDLYITATK